MTCLTVDVNCQLGTGSHWQFIIIRNSSVRKGDSYDEVYCRDLPADGKGASFYGGGAFLCAWRAPPVGGRAQQHR